MKLATLKDDSRDGRLVVVSRDLSQYQLVPKISATLQHALDHWELVAADHHQPAIAAVVF